jgi:hypothetical protein
MKTAPLPDHLTFACPKCASNRAYPFSNGMMRCKQCRFTAVLARFRLEKRPSLRWPALEIKADSDD